MDPVEELKKLIKEDDETFNLACDLEEAFSISNEIATLKDLSHNSENYLYIDGSRHFGMYSPSHGLEIRSNGNVGIGVGIPSMELDIFDPETNVGLGASSPNAALDIQTSQTQYWREDSWTWGEGATYSNDDFEPMTMETVQEAVAILETAPRINYGDLDEIRERIQNKIREALDNHFVGSRELAAEQYEIRIPDWLKDSLDDIGILNLGNIAWHFNLRMS